MRLNLPELIVAIDWSGSATVAGQRRHIAVASWRAGEVTLRSGFTRQEVGEWLLAEARKTPRMVVGFDFAFSFPAWFLRAQGCRDVFALWQLSASQGERWLSEGSAPFWGRPGQPRPEGHHGPKWLGFRRTDRALVACNRAIHPSSPFQIGGAGAVGTGSIRGMPILERLHQGGFHVWPFQPFTLPVVFEIYPRLFTGPVVKSSLQERTAYLAQPRFRQLPAPVLAAAAASEDAFDALCSVLGLADQAEHLTQVTNELSDDERLEGAIWQQI